MSTFKYEELWKAATRKTRTINSGKSYPEIHYIIDEEKRTVAAYMKNTAYDFLLNIDERLEKKPLMRIDVGNDNMSNYMIKPSYRAKAKCAPEDEFNIEVGVELAKARLLEKYYGDLTKATAKFNNELFNEVGYWKGKENFYFNRALSFNI